MPHTESAGCLRNSSPPRLMLDRARRLRGIFCRRVIGVGWRKPREVKHAAVTRVHTSIYRPVEAMRGRFNIQSTNKPHLLLSSPSASIQSVARQSRRRGVCCSPGGGPATVSGHLVSRGDRGAWFYFYLIWICHFRLPCASIVVFLSFFPAGDYIVSFHRIISKMLLEKITISDMSLLIIQVDSTCHLDINDIYKIT
jgi:hypothetical protein